MPTAEEIIQVLGLQPLPGEGGFFQETWKLEGTSNRPAGTAIMYLITPESFSALHRLDADEIFHFYAGDPCEQITISPAGALHRAVLGTDIHLGQRPQIVIPKGHWQGTKLLPGGKWALLGTTMTPGYHQAGFELATEADLQHFPADIRRIGTTCLANGA